MEHNKHMQDFEQDLHETAKRVSAAYKNVQPDKRLLENVLARIPELQATAVSTDHLLGAPSPYQRFFPLKKLAYIVSAALTIVLVAVASFSGTSNDPTRLAQESFVPEADRMAMMVEDAQPSLMVASEPAPEGDVASVRMVAPTAKMAALSANSEYRDISLRCDGKNTLFVRFPSPPIPGVTSDVTFPTGETVQLSVADGSTEQAGKLTNSEGYTLDYVYDEKQVLSAKLTRGADTIYDRCVQYPLGE